MSINPPKACYEPGCPNITHSTYCKTHTKKQSTVYDRLRGNSNKRGYTYRWSKERTAHLNRYPLCVECLKLDVIRTATEVDHIIPHKGDMKIFWNHRNWAGLCKTCHSQKTGREQAGNRQGKH